MPGAGEVGRLDIQGCSESGTGKLPIVASQERLMDPIIVSVVILACILAGVLGGWALAALLPPDHLTSDGRDTVKVSIAMVATISALVLGLLTADSKSAFDGKQEEVRTMASDVLRLDRLLAMLGPDTAQIRDDLKAVLGQRIAAVWPGQAADIRISAVQRGAGVEGILRELLALQPKGSAESWLQSQALDLANDIDARRWVLVAESSSAIQWPFVILVAFWLTIAFASFALFAPRNASVAVAMLVAAISVAGAFYLILEMDQPYSGLIRIESQPLLDTYASLGRP